MHAHVEKADGVEIQTTLKFTEIFVPLVPSYPQSSEMLTVRRKIYHSRSLPSLIKTIQWGWAMSAWHSNGDLFKFLCSWNLDYKRD